MAVFGGHGKMDTPENKELQAALKQAGLDVHTPEGVHINQRGWNQLFKIYSERKASGQPMTQQDVDAVRGDRERYIDATSQGWEAMKKILNTAGAAGLAVGTYGLASGLGAAGSTAAASGINFAAPSFDAMAGGALFNPTSPAAFNQAMATIGSSSAAAGLPSFMSDAFKTVQNAWGGVPQGLKNLGAGALGALASPQFGQVMDAYRQNRATDAMTDSIRDARGSINQGLGQAQNYLSQGQQQASQALTNNTTNANNTLAAYHTLADNKLQGTTNQARADIMPFYQGGLKGFEAQQGLMGLNGMSQLDALKATPGYQFNVDESLRAIENRNAARGLSGSPAERNEMARYVSGLAENTFNNRFNQLGTLANMGYGAGSQMANQQMTLGQMMSQNAMNTGGQIGQNLTNLGSGLSNNAMQTGNWQSANQMDASQSLAGLDAYKGQTLANAYMGFPTGANTNYTQSGGAMAPQQQNGGWLPGALSLAQMAFM